MTYNLHYYRNKFQRTLEDHLSGPQAKLFFVSIVLCIHRNFVVVRQNISLLHSSHSIVSKLQVGKNIFPLRFSVCGVSDVCLYIYGGSAFTSNEY